MSMGLVIHQVSKYKYRTREAPSLHSTIAANAVRSWLLLLSKNPSKQSPLLPESIYQVESTTNTMRSMTSLRTFLICAAVYYITCFRLNLIFKNFEKFEWLKKFWTAKKFYAIVIVEQNYVPRALQALHIT